jgi:Flp pilus assembly pilin Flp
MVRRDNLIVRQLIANRRGASVVEFALLLPVLAGFLYGIMAYGQYTMKRTESFAPVGAVNAMGQDAAGNLYFLTPTGDIYVVEPA